MYEEGNNAYCFSVLIIAALYVLYCFNYIPHKKYTNADFNIEAYKSNIDKDNDGIDDCIWRILTAGFAEQNGRNAKLNGRITFDY